MKYRVFWKGECLGSFSAEEMQDMLSRGALGLLHSVELKSGRMVSLSEFFSSGDLAAEGADSAGLGGAEFDFSTFGFLLAGMSFLSVYVLVSALVYCAFLLRVGRRGLALAVSLVSILLCLAGYIFFSELLPKI